MRGGRRPVRPVSKKSLCSGSNVVFLFVTLALGLWAAAVYRHQLPSLLSEGQLSIGKQSKSVDRGESELRGATIGASPDSSSKVPRTVHTASSYSTIEVIDPVQTKETGMGNGQQRRLHVAFAITLTKDGFFQDCAAVLAYSVYNISKSK